MPVIKLQTEYKYLHFVRKESRSITGVWLCINTHHSDILGEIKWYPGWRQYCYFPSVQAVYSSGCLEDIKYFIDQLMETRKRGNHESPLPHL